MLRITPKEERWLAGHDMRVHDTLIDWIRSAGLNENHVVSVDVGPSGRMAHVTLIEHDENGRPFIRDDDLAVAVRTVHFDEPIPDVVRAALEAIR